MRRPERFQAALVIWRCGTRGSRSVKGLILRAFAAFCPTGAGEYGTLCGGADFPGRPQMAPHWGDRRCRTSNTGWSIRACGRARPSSKCRAGPASLQPRTDGSHEYAWHCAPFTEGAQYGIEIFYPYENELHVSKKDGKLHFDGDFGPAPDARPAVAAVPQLRQRLLHLPASARSESRQGLGGAHRAASAVLYRHRPTRCRSRCRRCCAPNGGR